MVKLPRPHLYHRPTQFSPGQEPERSLRGPEGLGYRAEDQTKQEGEPRKQQQKSSAQASVVSSEAAQDPAIARSEGQEEEHHREQHVGVPHEPGGLDRCHLPIVSAQYSKQY